MTKLKMEYDLKALELTHQNSPALQNPTTQQPAFKVETAAKLLPKLSVDHELEVYLITFRKIAVLNSWPKEYWPSILQTQLKGKSLRIFSELPECTIKDCEQLQSAVLDAYELTPEHYRKFFFVKLGNAIKKITLILHLKCKTTSNAGYKALTVTMTQN